MRRVVMAGLAVLWLGALAGSAAANDFTLCFKSYNDSEQGVAACTRVLASKRLRRIQRARTYLTRGTHRSRMGQYAAAIGDFNKAYDLGLHKLPLLFEERSRAYDGLHQHDKSVADFNAALRLNPDEKARDRLLCYIDYLDTERNVAACTRIIESRRLDRIGQSRTYLWRGVHRRQMKQSELAIADFNKAATLGLSKLPLLYEERGSAYMDAGDLDKAVADFDTAIRLNPDDEAAYRYRAPLYFKRGQLDRALADYTQSIRLNPGNVEAYAARANVWRSKGEFDRALQDLNRALQLDPNYAAGHELRGLVYEAKGDPARAIAEYRAAIAAPSNYFFDDRYKRTAKARLALLAAAGQAPAAKPAPAEEQKKAAAPAAAPKAGRHIALVIGNGAYVAVPKLVNPPNDARAVAKKLRGMGFEVSEGIDLDRATMKRKVGDFLRAAASAKIALVFYAGHGMQIDGKNFLLPVDAELAGGKQLAAEMTDVDTILAGLDDQIRTNIIILDACRDNPLVQQVAQAAPSRSLASKVRSGLAAPSGLGSGATVGAGTLIAFATAPGRVALDGVGADSPFSLALVHHIATPGLEVQQMLTRVRAEVVKATHSEQVPWSNSSLLGEVYLAGKP